MRQTSISAVSRTLALAAAIATVGAFAAPKAEAGIWSFDFASWAAGKEGAYGLNPLTATNTGAPDAGVIDPLLAYAVGSDDPTVPGVGSYVTGAATIPHNGTPYGGGTAVYAGTQFADLLPAGPYAYLDAPSGGPGGLGVCSSTICSGNDDDNLNYGEILTLAFFDQAGNGNQISDLQIAPSQYSNSNHHVLNSDILISIDGGTFNTYHVNNGHLTTKLNGTIFQFKTAGNAYSTDSSYYISFAEVRTGGDKTSLPEPATLGLFGLGLAGVGLAVRRRRTKK
jgi:hypothetical protein